MCGRIYSDGSDAVLSHDSFSIVMSGVFFIFITSDFPNETEVGFS